MTEAERIAVLEHRVHELEAKIVPLWDHINLVTAKMNDLDKLLEVLRGQLVLLDKDLSDEAGH